MFPLSFPELLSATEEVTMFPYYLLAGEDSIAGVVDGLGIYLPCCSCDAECPRVSGLLQSSFYDCCR